MNNLTVKSNLKISYNNLKKLSNFFRVSELNIDLDQKCLTLVKSFKYRFPKIKMHFLFKFVGLGPSAKTRALNCKKTKRKIFNHPILLANTWLMPLDKASPLHSLGSRPQFRNHLR